MDVCEIFSTKGVTWMSVCMYVLDTMVCTGCCATLDNIITYLFKKLTRKQSKPANVESDTFLRMLELHPDILQQVSNTHTHRHTAMTSRRSVYTAVKSASFTSVSVCNGLQSLFHFKNVTLNYIKLSAWLM